MNLLPLTLLVVGCVLAVTPAVKLRLLRSRRRPVAVPVAQLADYEILQQQACYPPAALPGGHSLAADGLTLTQQYEFTPPATRVRPAPAPRPAKFITINKNPLVAPVVAAAPRSSGSAKRAVFCAPCANINRLVASALLVAIEPVAALAALGKLGARGAKNKATEPDVKSALAAANFLVDLSLDPDFKAFLATNDTGKPASVATYLNYLSTDNNYLPD